MKKIGRNEPCPCGSGKKYKRCCIKQKIIMDNHQKQTITMSRSDFISGPYKKCPNPQCLADDSFGVSICISGSKTYTRECLVCGYEENYPLPPLKKKVVYLDQFVISNLIKLLDKEHPSHEKIKSEPFWEKLFIKLEEASRSQAIVCPHSFYHVDESLTGDIDFRLMRRLYEHFSSGKTLLPGAKIEQYQITQHFEGWLEQKKVNFQLKPDDIAFSSDLHTWSIGIGISVNLHPYSGQVEKLQKINALTKEELKNIWLRWQSEKDITFTDRIHEEVLGLGKGLISAARQFLERRTSAINKMAIEGSCNFDLDDLLPPISNDILEALYKIARAKDITEDKIPETINKYFIDTQSLLEIPKVRINSVMYAGLAQRAAGGKKSAPKSTVDVQFISSYLPYCDALFVDIESALLLKEFPKNVPDSLRLKEFPAKVFSLRNKDEFLDYLDRLVKDIPASQIEILKDIEGEKYTEPYWNIIEHEKIELENQTK